MNYKKIVFFVVLLLATTTWLTAGGGDSLKIVTLQKEVAQLRDSVAGLQKDQHQVVKVLNAVQETASDPWGYLLAKFGLLGLFAVLLAIGAFWFINKTAPNWYVVLIQRLVERYEETNVLKRKKKILVLKYSGESDETNAFVQNMLDEFTVVETLVITDKFIAPKERFHIVFANFEQHFDKSKHQEILHQYITPGICLFALIPSSGWSFTMNADLNKKVSIANSRAQVYGNLLSLLKYHDLTHGKW